MFSAYRGALNKSKQCKAASKCKGTFAAAGALASKCALMDILQTPMVPPEERQCPHDWTREDSTAITDLVVLRSLRGVAGILLLTGEDYKHRAECTRLFITHGKETSTEVITVDATGSHPTGACEFRSSREDAPLTMRYDASVKAITNILDRYGYVVYCNSEHHSYAWLWSASYCLSPCWLRLRRVAELSRGSLSPDLAPSKHPQACYFVTGCSGDSVVIHSWTGEACNGTSASFPALARKLKCFQNLVLCSPGSDGRCFWCNYNISSYEAYFASEEERISPKWATATQI